MPSNQELQAQIDALQKANAELKAAAAARVTLKVSEKGAVSLYGLSARFPVTLYANQWESVLGMADQIRAFIKANASQLSVKGQAKAA